MKKKLIITILLILSSKLFAQTEEKLYSLILESNNRFWIPDNCINILYSKNKQKIKEYYPDIELLTFYHELEERNVKWDEFSCFTNISIVSKYDFTNDALCITSGLDAESLSFYFSFIKYENQFYYLETTKTFNCKQFQNKFPFSKWPIEEDECEIILKFDGDYLYVYLNDLKTLYGTFCRINNATLDEYNKLIKTGKCDLSKVTWPRHADGTCDYDGSKSTSTVSKTTTPSTNVSVNKTMVAYENLKLRSAEATSSSVITVMSSGTKVKILQLGEPEKIDGIDSNWVKVEVQKGAKDRDGKEIKEGTVGWCYGGYLKETANTSSEKKKKK